MLHRTIRNDDFSATQRCNVGTMLEPFETTLQQCWSHLKQRCNNVAALCCAKNRRCESSRLTSPLKVMLHETICNDDF